MVTHLTTDWPVTSLDRAERTGRLVLWYLWSYVKCRPCCTNFKGKEDGETLNHRQEKLVGGSTRE